MFRYWPIYSNVLGVNPYSLAFCFRGVVCWLIHSLVANPGGMGGGSPKGSIVYGILLFDGNLQLAKFKIFSAY